MSQIPEMVGAEDTRPVNAYGDSLISTPPFCSYLVSQITLSVKADGGTGRTTVIPVSICRRISPAMSSASPASPSRWTAALQRVGKEGWARQRT